MNAKTENKPMTIAEQIAYLQGIAERAANVMAAVGDDVKAIREADKAAIDSKNAADQMNGQRSTIWNHVRNVAFKVQELTANDPSEAAQVFSDVMAEFLSPAQVGTEKVKLTTAGQYASTGRKMLTELLIVPGADLETYRNATVKEVREAFKDVKVQARNTAAGEVGKLLRYAAKHATPEEWDAAFVLVQQAAAALYNPVKARKDKNSKKGEAARELADLQQQAPAEATTVETAAAELVGEGDAGEVQKQQAV